MKSDHAAEGKAGSRGTALITGASSGIGEAFARRLAQDGCDLVLVARREERLRRLADELRDRFGIRAEPFRADLSRSEEIERVENRIRQENDLSLLVNNAGFGTTGAFAEIDIGRQLDMITVHVTAPVRLCRAALPGMIDRGAGGIINVSSIAAWWPVRNGATYCATKAYLLSFSRSLHRELDGTGVRVQALCPGLTRTGFHDTEEFRRIDRSASPQWLWLSADRVVSESLKALDRNRVICIPGRRYRIFVRLVRNGLMLAVMRRMRDAWHAVHERRPGTSEG